MGGSARLRVAPWAIPFGGLAFSVTLIGMAAIDLGIQGRRGMFQFLLVLIGVRFLIFYVLCVGGLALTAAGLIGSGLLITPGGLGVAPESFPPSGLAGRNGAMTRIRLLILRLAAPRSAFG